MILGGLFSVYHTLLTCRKQMLVQASLVPRPTPFFGYTKAIFRVTEKGAGLGMKLGASHVFTMSEGLLIVVSLCIINCDSNPAAL